MCRELLTFNDAKTRFPATDRLKGSLPGERYLCERVPVSAVFHGRVVPTWLDACGQPLDRYARRLSDSRRS
jgi:hypothetical protein